MRLWIDDVRRPPESFVKCYDWVRTVNEAKSAIIFSEMCAPTAHTYELIDIDHDAGDFAWDGGDYIKLLDWLEETGRNYPIRIHSMNSVGVQNMRAIIQHNGWKEIR
jgi:hypothetical protein